MKIVHLATVLTVLTAAALAAGNITLYAGDVVFRGTYEWKRSKNTVTGPLKAVFTPDGKEKWKVVFKFTYQKKPYTYTGTVTGSLNNGRIHGDVLNETKKRKFAFSAVIKNGKMTGKHKEIKKRGSKTREINTGTMTLNLVKS